MRKISLAVTVLALMAAAYFLGALVEVRTHALHVAQVTGRPYIVILDPLHRNPLQSLDDSDADDFPAGIEGDRA